MDIEYFEDEQEALNWLSQEEIKKEHLPPLEADIKNREEEIKQDLEELIQKQVEISATNVAEADELKAREMIVNIYKKMLQ
jgi:hypothetical protein